MSKTNFVLSTWKKAGQIPGGKWLLSKYIARKAPYFTSVNPELLELRENYCKILIKKRKAIENHIGTVHVIAICNELEMAMGVLAEASVPSHLRWIPKGMEVDYTAKAGSDITGVATVNAEDWKPGDLYVKIQAFDTSGVVVVDGRIKLWISEKPPAKK